MHRLFNHKVIFFKCNFLPLNKLKIMPITFCQYICHFEGDTQMSITVDRIGKYLQHFSTQLHVKYTFNQILIILFCTSKGYTFTMLCLMMTKKCKDNHQLGLWTRLLGGHHLVTVHEKVQSRGRQSGAQSACESPLGHLKPKLSLYM